MPVITTTPFKVPTAAMWDLSNASFNTSFSVNTQTSEPSGITFKPDGTKMYISENISSSVVEYDLSPAWDVSSAVFNQSFTATASFTDGIAFRTDGTRMFLVGFGGAVFQYNLSPAWDVSSASFVNSKSTTQDSSMQGIAFRPDGTKMYTAGVTNDAIYEYNVTTPWTMSAANVSFVQSFSVSTQDATPTGVVFNTDGTKMFMSGDSGNSVYEYTLSVPWDISSASFIQSFSVASQDSQPRDLAFNSDGTILFVVGDQNNSVYAYNL